MSKRKRKKKHPSQRRAAKADRAKGRALGRGVSAWRQAHKPGDSATPVLPGFLRWCTRYGLYVVLALVVAYVAAFCAISHFKYHHFNYDDFDLAIFSNAMWNTAHGDFMFTEIRAGCYFKDHVPVILLALVPLYALLPSPLTLLYAQSIMLGAGAIPLFLLARRETNGFWGILFALMYLLYPALGFINLFEFHALAFVPVLLLFALYFFRAAKYVPFLVFAGLAMLCREEVSLTVMMVGVYALMARRRWHWIIAPAAAGLIWFLVCFYVVIPHFNKGQNIYGALYGEMGHTPGEVITTAITQPGKTIRIALKKEMRPGRPPVDKPGYLGKVFTPVSYLALANPEALLISAPQFALNLLVDTNVHAPPPTIYFQYTANVIPVLLFSSVLGLARLLRVRVLRQFWFIPAAVVVLISASTWVFWSPQLAPRAGPPRNIAGTRVHQPDDVAQYRAVLDAVPKGVPVVATFRFLHGLTDRHVLTSFHYIYMGREKVASERRRTLPDEVAWAVLDLRPRAKWALMFGQRPEDADNFYRLLTAGDWGIEAQRGQLVVLRKNAPELPKLIRAIDEPELAAGLGASYGGVIKLLGVEADRDEIEGFVQIRVRTAWELLGRLQLRHPDTNATVDDRLLIDFALFDRNNALVWSAGSGSLEAPRPTAALDNLALAPALWTPGDRFEVQHGLLVPDSVPAGTYKLGLLVASTRAGMILPPSGEVLGKRYAHIMNITLFNEVEP